MCVQIQSIIKVELPSGTGSPVRFSIESNREEWQGHWEPIAGDIAIETGQNRKMKNQM